MTWNPDATTRLLPATRRLINIMTVRSMSTTWVVSWERVATTLGTKSWYRLLGESILMGTPSYASKSFQTLLEPCLCHLYNVNPQDVLHLKDATHRKGLTTTALQGHKLKFKTIVTVQWKSYVQLVMRHHATVRVVTHVKLLHVVVNRTARLIDPFYLSQRKTSWLAGWKIWSQLSEN